jgi:hypothetical protein
MMEAGTALGESSTSDGAGERPWRGGVVVRCAVGDLGAPDAGNAVGEW